jgi:DNA sulfur modification protein DndC
MEIILSQANLSLFENESDHQSVVVHKIRLLTETAEERARGVVTEIMRAGHICVAAYSSGKDSSCLTSVMLICASDLKARGFRVPPLVVVHSATGIENPEITRLAFGELEKMQSFAKKHGLDFTVLIGEPELNDSFPVRVISGRALPSFVNSRGDCTIDLKINPNAKQLRLLMERAKDMGDWKPPVVMTGVRLDESDVRNRRIEGRGETGDGIWVNEFGHLRASPLLHHSADDIWEHLGMCGAGVFDSYSDFGETMRIYRDAGGSSCVLVADMKLTASSKACTARTGCWACLRTGSADRSAEQMIESDVERYGYMKPLNRLRNWLARTQYNWDMRQFVGRTISKDGSIEIGADTYSPDTLRDLLVYTLTAERLSGVPIISIEQLVAIDARWSMYAIAPPSAL